MDRLSAAADAASGAGHNFYEVVGDAALFQLVEELSGIAQTVDDRDLERCARQVENLLLPAVHAADVTEGIGSGILAGDKVVGASESGLHDASSRAENVARAGTDAERHIRLGLRELRGVEVLQADQADKLAVRDGDIHFGCALVIDHGRVGALRLLGQAGHDRDNEDLGGIHVQELSVVALGDGAEHLLRRLGGRELVHELGIVRLAEPHPAGAAGGEHREFLFRSAVLCLCRFFDLLEELAGLLHDGQVCGEVGVKDIIEADVLEERDQAAVGRELRFEAEALTPGSADRRCHLDDRDDVRILESEEHPVEIIALTERADRTVGDTLAAEHTLGVLQTVDTAHIDRSPGTGVQNIPDACGLHIIADLDAAHALDALVILTDQGEVIVRPGNPGQVLFEGDPVDVQVIGDLLQGAVPVAGTYGTVGIVLGEDQLDIDLSGLSRFL